MSFFRCLIFVVVVCYCWLLVVFVVCSLLFVVVVVCGLLLCVVCCCLLTFALASRRCSFFLRCRVLVVVFMPFLRLACCVALFVACC